MSQIFVIHPLNPQARLIKQAANIIQNGGVVVYPTDSSYGIGCRLEDKQALDRIRSIRKLEENHHFTLLCKDLSELSTYAIVNNTAFRILKANTPGPFTFILKGTKEVPRRLLQPKRSTIGLRVSGNSIIQALLEELGEPLMNVTLTLPGEDHPLENAQDIYEKLSSKVDLVIDGGPCNPEQTTIVDLMDDEPKIIRLGSGNPNHFL